MTPMSQFVGGSPYAMVQQIAGGYLLLTERNFRRFGVPELNQLATEIEKVLREIRGDQPQLDDQVAVRERQRKMQRLNTCRNMLQSYRSRMRR